MSWETIRNLKKKCNYIRRKEDSGEDEDEDGGQGRGLDGGVDGDEDEVKVVELARIGLWSKSWCHLLQIELPVALPATVLIPAPNMSMDTVGRWNR